MTGECVAVWRDQHQLAAPAAHTSFGISGVIIRNNVFDANLSSQALFGFFQDLERAIKLRASGQQIFAIGEGPAVILNVCEFDAGGAGGFSEGEHFFDLVNVPAVNDEIQGDSDANVGEPLQYSKFLRVSLCAGDFVSGFLVGSLKA